MFKYAAFYALSIVFLSFGAASAAEDCDQYTVMRGDTLRLIAERYYGARDFSPILYEANQAIIGPDANTIEIGMELAIPCRDNLQMPLSASFLSVIEPTVVNAPAPRFLAKLGGSPFLGRDGSGIIPDILGAALRKAGYRDGLNLDNTEAASGVLETAAADYAALLSFPWIRPDCTRPETLSDVSGELCAGFAFSSPLYEITLGLFARADDPLVSTDIISDFSQKSICIPGFHNDDLLRKNGIFFVTDNISYLSDFNTCMAGLNAGEFDVILADYQSFNTFYTPENGEVSDIAAFAQKTTIHAVAYRNNPEAMRVLEVADAGLQQILASGEWFGIVTEYLNSRSN